MDRFGRRASLRHFRTSGPLPAKAFATIGDDGKLQLVKFPPSGNASFQPIRQARPDLRLEGRSGIEILLLLVLVAFHLPAP